MDFISRDNYFSGFSAVPDWSQTTADEAIDSQNRREAFEERRQQRSEERQGNIQDRREGLQEQRQES